MIRAVIFDFFGVLVSDGWLPFKNKYFGDDLEAFEKASKINKQYDEGAMDYEKFIGLVSGMAGVSEEETMHYIRSNVPDEKLLDYIRDELKPKYKIGLLSNAGANWLHELLDKTQIELFDAFALSYETGIVKPDPQAYKIITEKLSVKPQESVFIDDQERFVVAARDEGMKAITYKDFPQLKKELEKLLTTNSDN